MRMIEQQVAEYLNWCENIRRMTNDTMIVKRYVLEKVILNGVHFKVDDIRDIDNQMTNNWVLEMTARGCSGQTVNNRLNILISAVRYFQDMGLTFPKFKVSLVVKAKTDPPRRTYYTREQIDQVLKYCDMREWLMIKLCFDCGLRISELRNLRLKGIKGRHLTFIGKGRKARESYMSPETRAVLDTWIEREKITDYIWKSKKGKPLCTDTIRDAMREPFHKAGFTDFYPHALRHSFATDITKRGASIEVAKEMLGHSSISTTQRYVHSLEGRLGELFESYKFNE